MHAWSCGWVPSEMGRDGAGLGAAGACVAPKACMPLHPPQGVALSPALLLNVPLLLCLPSPQPENQRSDPLLLHQEEMRETSVDDFRYEDLERLPTEELARITEWLTEKVDALSTRLKAEPKEDEVGRGGRGEEGGRG